MTFKISPIGLQNLLDARKIQIHGAREIIANDLEIKKQYILSTLTIK